MTTSQKINLLINFEDSNEFTDEDYKIIKQFYNDSDAFVRSRVAYLLINFITEESKNLLLKLAHDKDDLVRLEAFDSLSAFEEIEVAEFLKNLILNESDELAKSYAIISWADVLTKIDKISDDDVAFAKQNKQKEKTTDCALSWCYALYWFKEKNALDDILSFLKNDNYQIRCSAINHLKFMINEYNSIKIKNHIKKSLISETSLAVKDCAESLLNYY